MLICRLKVEPALLLTDKIMKIYEPIAISLFTVLVLGASFFVGKSVGYKEAMTQNENSTLTKTQTVSNEANN